MEALCPGFSLIEYSMVMVEGYDYKEVRKIKEVSNTLSQLQIEVFNKWKKNFTNESVQYINLAKDDKLRTELNSKCKRSWDLKLE